MTKTNFSFEVPTAHLEDFADLQDYFFCLSMLCNDPHYVSFHRRQAMYGCKQIWLDNSFNETGVADNVNALHSNILELRAHKLVIPDDLKWSTDQMISSYNACSSLLPNHMILTVVTTEEMHKALTACGARHFALPYRTRLAAYAPGFPPGILEWAKGFHFLGLCSLEEIQVLQPPTCDTRMPIKLALRGWDLRKWYSEGEPHIHTRDIVDSFFSAKLTKSELVLAKNNIIMLKEMCNNV